MHHDWSIRVPESPDSCSYDDNDDDDDVQVSKSIFDFYRTQNEHACPRICRPGYRQKVDLDAEDRAEIVAHIKSQMLREDEKIGLLRKFDEATDADIQRRCCGLCGFRGEATGFETKCSVSEAHKSGHLIDSAANLEAADQLPSFTHDGITFDMRKALTSLVYGSGDERCLMRVHGNLCYCHECGARWDAPNGRCSAEACEKGTPCFDMCARCRVSDTAQEPGSEFSLSQGNYLFDLALLPLPERSYLERLVMSPARDVGFIAKVGHVGSAYNRHTARTHFVHMMQDTIGRPTHVRGCPAGWLTGRLEQLPNEIEVQFLDDECKKGWESRLSQQVPFSEHSGHIPEEFTLDLKHVVPWIKVKICLEYWAEKSCQSEDVSLVTANMKASKMFAFDTNTSLEGRLQVLDSLPDDAASRAKEGILENSHVSSFQAKQIEQYAQYSVSKDSAGLQMQEGPDETEALEKPASHSMITSRKASDLDQKSTTAAVTQAMISLCRKDRDLVNEFDYLEDILDSRWDVFPLGSEKMLTKQKRLRVYATEWMVQHASPVMRDRRLSFFIANMTQRHALTRSVSYAVTNMPEAFKPVLEMLNDDDVGGFLKKAAANEDSPEARQLLKLVNDKCLHVRAGQADYTPQRREAALSESLSLSRMYGNPIGFVTVNLDDWNIPAAVLGAVAEKLHREASPDGRLDLLCPDKFPLKPSGFGKALSGLCGQRESVQLPVSEGTAGPHTTMTCADIVRMHKYYPVPSVLASSDWLKKIQALVLGCPTSSFSKRLDPDGRVGAFGRHTRASYGVLESQQRDALHLHTLLFGGVHDDISRSAYCMRYREIFEAQKEYYDSINSERVDIEFHVLRITLDAAGKRVRFVTRPIECSTPEDSRKMCSVIATVCGTHNRHRQVCSKHKDQSHCRMSFTKPHDIRETRITFIIDDDRPGDDENDAVFKPCEFCKRGHLDIRATTLDLETEEDFWSRVEEHAKGIWEFRRDLLEDVALGCIRHEGEDLCTVASRIKALNNEDLTALWKSALSKIVVPQLDKIGAAFLKKHFGFENVAGLTGLPTECNDTTRKVILRALMELVCLPCHNGYLVSFNPVLSAAARSNTNSIIVCTAVGAAVNAKAALFYIAKYNSKNTQRLRTIVSAMSDAKAMLERIRRRIAGTQTQADDANTSGRNLKRILQFIQNTKLNRNEMFECEVIAKLLNIRSEQSTHCFKHLNVRAAATHISKKHGLQEHKSTEEDAGHVTIMKTPDGKYEASSFWENYENRGPNLAELSLYEYFCRVRIERNDRREYSRCCTLTFAEGHPLRHTHVQVMQQKFVVPIITGKSQAPTIADTFWACPLLDETDVRHACKKFKIADATGRFYAALFVPWSLKSGHPEYTDEEGHQAPITNMAELITWFRQQPRSLLTISRWRKLMKYSQAINGQNNKDMNDIRNRTRDTWKKPPGVGRSRVYQWAGPLEEPMRIIEPERTMSPSEDRIQQDAFETAAEMQRLCSNQDAYSRELEKQTKRAAVEEERTKFAVDQIESALGEKTSKPAGSSSLRTASVGPEQLKTLATEIQKDPPPGARTSPGNDDTARRWANTLITTSTENRVTEGDRPPGAPDILNELQRKIAARVITSLEAVRAARYSPGVKDPERLHFLHGGGGVGKTYVLRAVTFVCDTYGLGDILMLAHAGVAAGNMEGRPGGPRGRTLASLVGMRRRKKSEPQSLGTSSTKFSVLSKYFPDKVPGLVWVDEVSMVSCDMFQRLNMWLCDYFATARDVPFGGCVVVASGDVLQLPPVRSMSLMSACVNSCRPSPRKNADDSDAAGVFTQFVMHELKEQQRSQDDGHTRRLEMMRDPDSENPFSPMKNELQVLSPSDAADAAWLVAPCGCFANHEKDYINITRAKVFAAQCKKYVIRWPLDTVAPPEIEATEWDVVRKNSDRLYEYFVEDAPIVMDTNVKVERNIVNGSVGTFHSIVWGTEGNEFTTEPQFESARQKADARNEIVVTLDKPPLALFLNLKDVIRTGTNLENTQHEDGSTSVLVPVQPMKSRNDKKFRPLTAEQMKLTRCNPEIHIATKFPVTLNFASTMHKLQSRTVPKVILSLQKHVTGNPFELLLTGMSRTRRGADIRILGTPKYPADIHEMLDKTAMPQDTKAFLAGYPQRSGKFSHKDCKAEYDRMKSPKSKNSRNDNLMRNSRRTRQTTGPESRPPKKRALQQDDSQLKIVLFPQKRRRSTDVDQKQGKRRRSVRILKKVDEETEDLAVTQAPTPADPLRPLETKENELYEVAMNKDGDSEEVLATNEGSHLRISRGDLACMRAPEWLNDETVNFYMALLNDRDARDREGPGLFPRCHFFNTFFYAKLEKDGYKGVKRWSLPKKLVYKHKDIHSAVDRIIFPIHRPGHWTAAMVDVKEQRIVYLDSMSTGDRRTHGVAEALAEWYKLDRADKKNEDLPVDRWPIELWECPQQRNGYDCGMFASKFCDFLGRGAEFSFGQEHMGLFRKRLVAEIYRNRAE